MSEVVEFAEVQEQGDPWYETANIGESQRAQLEALYRRQTNEALLDDDLYIEVAADSPLDDKQAAWIVREFARVAREEEDAIRNHEEEIARLRNRKNGLVFRYRGLLKAHAESKLQGKLKSTHYPGAKVAIRDIPEKLVVTDLAVVEKQAGEDYLVDQPKKFDKDRYLKDSLTKMREDGTIPDGIERQAARQELIVQVAPGVSIKVENEPAPKKKESKTDGSSTGV